MPRVKRGVTARARHKKIINLAKGYRGRRNNVYRIAKQAVEKAGSFEVDKVRTALVGQKFKGPAGEVTMQENHHLVNNVYIGETLANGQFKIIKTLRVPSSESQIFSRTV